ncbi:MAG: DNA-directed RNA polymerase subunit beta [Clostridia bacterium]|nr:DNA-directed RNA polymerase subunit beta [Clostridia bacterium]
MGSSNLNVKKVKYGKQERYKFGRIDEILDIPYLVEVQRDSYNKFLTTGIRDVLRDFSPITDTDNLNRNDMGEDKDCRVELHFLEHSLTGTPKYSEAECKTRDATYSLPLKVKIRLVYKETGEVVDQEVFMGDIPLMTENGSFIINGAERAVVSQLVRSPGVYCKQGVNKTGNFVVETAIMPARGAWLEFEEDQSGVLWVHVDRNRKMVATIFLRAMGIGSDAELLRVFDNHPVIQKTIEKDFTKSEDEALIEISKRLRPGEVFNLKAIKKNLEKMFYYTRRYDISPVGRYKYNQKLAIANRIAGKTLTEDVVVNGKMLGAAGEVVSEETARAIQNAGVNRVAVAGKNGTFYVTGNNRVDINTYLGINPKEAEIDDLVHLPTLLETIKGCKNKEEKEQAIIKNRDELMGRHLMFDDIVASVNYHLSLGEGLGSFDDVDHLGNRRVKTVGELLTSQFFIGMARLERVISERMQVQNVGEVSPNSLINVRPVSAAIREFFGSSQMSQFMEQTNPIASLTHKRKVSSLGPGALTRERAGFEVRDVHYTHYGRLCPNETPEGQNIGLINSLATYSKINKYGFLEAPYRKINKETGEITNEVVYMTADEEEKYIIAQANEPITADGKLANSTVICRKQGEIIELPRAQIDYIDVSPKELVSIATTLVPFIENDDATRAMMASNMQRQAVPLLKTESPIVATGVEHKIAVDSGAVIVAKNDGVVTYVSADKIIVTTDNGQDEYNLTKFVRSNNGTCMCQKPIISHGDKVKKGEVLADGPATKNGELAIGKNILIAFMPWEGYNFEDAILISEKLVQDDVLTSIHIEEYEIDARDTKLGPEDITRDIPNLGEEALHDLDENGIIRVGAEVVPGDILVGKVTPKGETELTPEERLLRAIFGEKAREVRDTSLRVQHGEGGVVVDVKVFTRENKDELGTGVNKLVRVYIAQKRKMSVGDKMSGRHGNKGVVSRILPEADMPFLPDGTPIQIILNPLGVPSRMNIGQLLEMHLGFVAKALDWKVATPVFDGAKEEDIKELFRQNGFPEDGKMQLYDGRTGEPFENRATVGYMYMLKLHHLVDDKMHARSTGPYSLVTQQPLGGKAQFGGQRFGEMEVWALEAYGAANMLQEMLTVKSDDTVGRVKTYESIVKNENVTEPGIPESFKVLIKELQGLALDIKVLTEDKQEIGLKDLIEDDRDLVDIRSERKKTQEEVEVAMEEELPSEDDDLGVEFEAVYDPNEDALGAGNLFDLDDDF